MRRVKIIIILVLWCYHAIWEAVAMGECLVGHIPLTKNLADLATKIIPGGQKWDYLVDKVLHELCNCHGDDWESMWFLHCANGTLVLGGFLANEKIWRIQSIDVLNLCHNKLYPLSMSYNSRGLRKGHSTQEQYRMTICDPHSHMMTVCYGLAVGQMCIIEYPMGSDEKGKDH